MKLVSLSDVRIGRLYPGNIPGTHSFQRLSRPQGHSVAGKCAIQDATRHNPPIHNILSTAPQLSIFQKALGTLPEDGNVVPKHVGATIHN
jgi:hypothetical protein